MATVGLFIIMHVRHDHLRMVVEPQQIGARSGHLRTLHDAVGFLRSFIGLFARFGNNYNHYKNRHATRLCCNLANVCCSF